MTELESEWWKEWSPSIPPARRILATSPDLSMMQPILVATISLTAFLIVLLLNAGYALLSDVLQNRSSNKRHLASGNYADNEIRGRLKQTYANLSLSRRHARWREVLVVKVVQESEDVRSFYLVDQGYEPLPAALPGQHILVQCTRNLGAHGDCRCYTLSDDTAAGHWRITVKKNSDRPESISRWLHEEISAGDTLKVKGPSGSFYLQPSSERKVVLVSAGVGITPMLPMLIDAIRRPSQTVYVFAQFRDVAHMPFADSLSDLATKHPNVSMNLWISRFPSGVKGSARSLFHEGKFQSNHLIGHDGATNTSDYYLCGPEAWQEKIRTGLLLAGVPSESIRFELFQSAETPTLSNENMAEHNIHFKQSGSNARFESCHRNLLTCAGRNNVSLESGCRTGACGSCAVKLLRGKVRYTRRPQFHTQSNDILPCVCVPETDIELDA